MTSSPSGPLRLTALSGSLREASANTAILRTLAQAVAGRAQLDLYPLDGIPAYNEDHDGDGAPEAVRALKRQIAASDGVVVCSPEFNHGIPGVLKNALDWASRPALRSPFKGKPVLVMTASPAATGGVRAQYQIRETLASMLAHVVATREVVIGAVQHKIRDGSLVDHEALAFALAAMDDLLAQIEAGRLVRAGLQPGPGR